MKKGIDCQVFQDQLDLLRSGELPDQGFEGLGRHAAACPDCAVLLEMHGHLISSSLEELEAAVPAEYVASMWDRVRSELATRESGRGGARRGRPLSRWLVPALAAASVVLLVSTAFLLGELSRVRASEQALARQLAQHERRLADLELPSSGASVALLGLGGRRAWERQLARRENVSVAELKALLESVPSNTTLLGPTRLAALGELPAWIVLGWGEVLDEIRNEDGIQAGEALRALEKLNLKPDTRIPVERLLELGRVAPRAGSS